MVRRRAGPVCGTRAGGYAGAMARPVRTVTIATNQDTFLVVVSATVATGFVIAGLVKLRHHRLSAYRQFERALLITVFVTQVFVFAESSFSAATGMVVAILLLLTIRYMLRQEERRAAEGGPVPATA